MRIVVVGAGPAGLYFALLAKKAQPSHRITVIERNPSDATYGWGVVFSEETLGALRDADRPTFEEITDTFAKWTAIDVRYRPNGRPSTCDIGGRLSGRTATPSRP